MKISISNLCSVCLQENNAENAKEIYAENRKKPDYKVELNSENIYKVTCDKGHTTSMRLQSENFEILFDLAALALNDGYSKESYTTMFSSYERFVEFFIKVICHHKSIPYDDFLKSWNLMAKQSERQIGAFFIIQLLEFGSVKYSMHKDWIELRNKIVHKGHIPSSKKVIEFGNYLLNLIQTALIDLNVNYPKSILLVSSIWNKPNYDNKISIDVFSSNSIPTMIDSRGIENDTYGKVSFEVMLEEMKINPFYMTFYSKA